MIRKLVTNQSNKAALQMPCVRVDRNNPIIMEDYLPRVVEDLLDTATDLKDKCAGLSSNQIGYGAHAFAVKFGAEYIVLVNAEIISRDGGINAAFERCLSLVNKGGYMLPGVKKRRHKRIKVRFYDPIAKEDREMKFKGFDARVVQHEMDHMKGILI